MANRKSRKMTKEEKVYYSDLGNRIQRIREKVGKSQEQVARRIGFGKQYISNLEAGYSRIRVYDYIMLCEAINSDPSVLLKSDEGKANVNTKIYEELQDLNMTEQEMVLQLLRTYKRNKKK